MFANIRRRIFVRRALRGVDRQVKSLMQDQARGQRLAKTVRISGPGWKGTLTPATGTVNVRIEGRVEVIHFDPEVTI